MAQCRFGGILDWSAGGISGTSGVGGLAGWGWKELARLAGAAEIKGITLEGQTLTEEKGNYRRLGIEGSPCSRYFLPCRSRYEKVAVRSPMLEGKSCILIERDMKE